MSQMPVSTFFYYQWQTAGTVKVKMVNDFLTSFVGAEMTHCGQNITPMRKFQSAQI